MFCRKYNANITLFLLKVMNKIVAHKSWSLVGNNDLNRLVSECASKPRSYLISCQDPEGGHDLLRSVSISRLSGHKVNERLEGDDSSTTGVHQHHYTGKLHLSLRKAWTERDEICTVRG